MSRRASWRELSLGVIGAAVLAGVALAVLVFARVGGLHGSTFRLYALTDEARGIIRGSEVWLGGQKVGVVKDVSFLPPTAPSTNRLLIAMDVLSSARQGIRKNSSAQVRAGGTLIGAPVVYMTIGSSTAREVVAEDTLRTLPQSDIETMSSQLAIASRQVPEIIDNMKLLNAELHGVRGTLGAFGVEGGGVELTHARRQLSRLSAKLLEPSGTVGLALNSDSSLSDRAHRVMARADSVRTLLASNSSMLGRFRRDSTLLREVADIRNELDIVRARMATPTGTVGRARADSTLVKALADTHREMTLIMADIRRRPLRYVHF